MLNSFNVLVVATTVLSLQVNSAHGFWRLLCDGSVGLARIDPLTNLGGVSDHVHSIKGGSGKSNPKCAFISPHDSFLSFG